MLSNLGSYRFKNFAITYRVGSEDEKVLSHSFENDIFYKEIPSFRPRSSASIIDVGSHIGTFALYSAINYPQSTVYAIEASKDSYEILVKNVKDNGLNNIIPIHAALTDIAGKVRLYHNDKAGNWGHSITKQFSDSYEEVDAITLSELKIKFDIDRIDLIKFNCEGAEFAILDKLKDDIRSIDLALILYHEDLVGPDKKIEKTDETFTLSGFRTLLIRRDEKRGRGWLICWNKKRYTTFYRFFSWLSRGLSRIIK